MFPLAQGPDGRYDIRGHTRPPRREGSEVVQREHRQVSFEVQIHLVDLMAGADERRGQCCPAR